MNKIKSIIGTLLTFCLLFAASCSDKDIYIEEEDTQTVAGISIEGVEGNTITIIEDDTYTVKIKVNPENAQDIGEYTEFSYLSGNDEIFTITAAGVITTHARGNATLLVTAKNNPEIKLVCMISVVERIHLVESIVLSDGLEGGKFLLNAQINVADYLTVLPELSQNKELTFKSSNEAVATVNARGQLTIKAVGTVTITATSTDGSNISKEVHIEFIAELPPITGFTALDRKDWTITTTHPFVSFADVGGAPEKLIDGDNATGLALNKPGKGGIGEMEIIGFTIESTAEMAFNTIRHVHRKGYTYLNVQGIDLLGSNDGIHFDVIQRGIAIPYETNQSEDVERIVPLAVASKYQYVRVEYSSLITTNGNSAQVMEFELGTATFD